MRSKATQQKLKFCVECGKDLDEFWSDPRANDFKEVLKRRIECLNSGRPAHRMCAKLFIADARDPLPATVAKKSLPKKRLEDLKSKVMGKIAVEEAKAKRKRS